jgi:hypothetical protein
MIEFSIDTMAFFRDPPIPITVTMGWDRPTNMLYLYIELRDEADKAFASPEDLEYLFHGDLTNGFSTTSSLDNYLNVFRRYKIFIPPVVAKVLQDHSLRDYISDRTREFLEGLVTTIRAKYSSLSAESVRIVNDKICILIDDYYNKTNCDFPSVEEHYSDFCGDVVDQIAAYYGYDAPEDEGDPVLRYAEFVGMDELLEDPDIPKEDREKMYWKLSRELDSHEAHFKLMAEQPEDFAPIASYDSPPIEVENAAPFEPKRLFLGEGDFSFSTAYLKKHEANVTLGQQMVATELSSSAKVVADHGQKAKDNITHLAMNGVTVHFGVDARQIHTFFKTRFRRIHFNCPHDRKSYKGRTLPKIISEFFGSARRLQDIGDKVLMALPKEIDVRKQPFRESYIYKVYEAAAKHGYKAVQKRPFGPLRYPGYQHVMTGENVSATVAEEVREHVFQLIEPSSDQTALNVMLFKSPTDTYKANFYKKNEAHLTETNFTLPEMDTDDESSDCDLNSHPRKADDDNNLDDLEDLNRAPPKKLKSAEMYENDENPELEEMELEEVLESSRSSGL